METTNDNEPGSRLAPTPQARQAKLIQLVTNLEQGSDARAGLGAILREIEALHPGAIDREQARIQRRRLGLPPLSAADVQEAAARLF